MKVEKFSNPAKNKEKESLMGLIAHCKSLDVGEGLEIKEFAHVDIGRINRIVGAFNSVTEKRFTINKDMNNKIIYIIRSK